MGKGKTSSGEVKVTKDLDIQLEGADVLIVEDIVDSGVTLSYLMKLFAQRRPHSFRIAALLDKPERRLRPVHGARRLRESSTSLSSATVWIKVEKYRNLDSVCVLEE